MIDKRIIFEIHRLKNLGYSNRKIAKELGTGRDTVKKYLGNPVIGAVKRSTKKSKLDPYRDLIDQYLESDPLVKAPVVHQRITEKGFDGKITIVRDYLRRTRGKVKNRQAFIRFESEPGKQMQIDWGHFQSLPYGKTQRKLYAMAVIECYSRTLYVEFAHSQKQESLHQILINAFNFFGGTPEQIVVDNMLTAVIERVGRVIRFNEAFLDFLRPFKVTPYACNVRAPQEKGKVESSIKYVRGNFWPLRKFAGLDDVRAQSRQWLDTVANIRIHQTTGERPADRFKNVVLNPLPEMMPDARETAQLMVHKDFAVRFDGNAYTTPPWAVGKRLTLKADTHKVAIYKREKKIAEHLRSWDRKQRIESPSHLAQVKRIKRNLWHDKEVAAFSSMGSEAREYLRALSKSQQPIKKDILRLLVLKDEYGLSSLIYAIKKALEFKAYGADYIENILYQEMMPENRQPLVKLKNEALNRIRLCEPKLEDYDAYAVRKNKK